MSDAARYQALYDNLVTWLDSHGISVAGLWAEHFNVRWLLTKAQYVTGRINSTLGLLADHADLRDPRPAGSR